jgi:hypothetical protein
MPPPSRRNGYPKTHVNIYSRQTTRIGNKSQNNWIFGICPSSGIPKTIKHHSAILSEDNN